MSSFPVNLLAKQTPWYGSKSGYYEQFPGWLRRVHPNVHLVLPRRTLCNRVIGKLYSVFKSLPQRDQSETVAELAMLWRAAVSFGGVNHILNIEDHLALLGHWRKAPRNWVGTIHFPREWWDASRVESLSRLSSAIALYRADIPFFENILGPGRVKYVPHGVDVDFFRPPPPEIVRGKSALFVGQFGRNTRMFARVAALLAREHPDLTFHVVVAPHARTAPGFDELAAHPSVRWHQEISEESLLTLFQTSQILLLPMDFSGANNAIVQAVACGLPIVTTDLGGIRDYGGGEIFPVVANNDDAAMVQLAGKFLAGREWREETSKKLRKFAEETLGWPIVIQDHLRAYAGLRGNEG